MTTQESNGCRPVHHNLLHDPSERAIVIVEDDDLDPRPNAAIPPPDGDSDRGDLAKPSAHNLQQPLYNDAL